MAIDSEGETRPFPHPLGPVSSLRRQLDEALASMPPPKAGEPAEGPSRLARAWDLARLYAYPKNRPDWDAVERAGRHRDAMPAGRVGPEALTAAPRWEFVGPKSFDAGGSRWVSGRVNAVAVDPGRTDTMYIGAAGGGVWKSRDRGETWEPLSNAWPFQEISSIAIDPKNTNTLYVGTGDFHAWSVRSFGLMKSTDGGGTWTNLAVAEAGAVSISDIVVDLAQPAVVIMCGGRGRQGYGYVWRSTDGGRTFARAIDVAAEWAKLAVGREDGSGNQPYYAAGWNGSGGLLYRSLDRGQTWTQLSPPWGAGQWGISVAASRVDTNNVYVMAGVDRRIYASGDRGATWRDISANVRRDDFEWRQLWYDWALACNTSGGVFPHDRVFLGLLHLQVWDAELGTWKEMPHGHDDVHALVPHPGEITTLMIGNDGGVYLLSDMDGGPFLKPLNKRLWGVTECYRSAGGWLAATQDNAVAAVSAVDPNSWRMVFPPAGGDAIAACINPAKTDVQFIEGGVAFHGIRRTADRFASPGVDITPKFRGDRLDPFAMPIVMDSGGTRLYFGTDYLWIRDEATGAWDAQVGGQKLAGTDQAVRALAVAFTNRDRVYAGSTDGQLWMGEGPAWRWTRIDGGLPDRVIGAISVDPGNPDDILVALGGGGVGHVWRCRNTRAVPPVWENVSGAGASALPDVPAIGVAHHFLPPSQIFYAATTVGMFATKDAGRTWFDITVPRGLPTVEVTDLSVTGCFLDVATFGRGIWRLNVTDF